MLISGSDDAGMWFWDTITMQFIRTESVRFEGSSTLVWRPNAQQLFGLEESAIYAYDISSQEISFDFPDRRTKQVTAIAVSPDGDSLASGDSDGVIRIIDTATRQLVTSIQTGADTVTALDWNLDGTELASGYTDGTVEIWDTISGTSLLTLVGHIDRISQIKWRPDSNTLASASYDGTVRIWNLETGFSGIITYPGKVLDLDWKPDGSQLAYGGVRNDYQDTQVVIVEPPQPSIPISTLTPAP
jgi:WD40 repeat protein